MMKNLAVADLDTMISMYKAAGKSTTAYLFYLAPKKAMKNKEIFDENKNADRTIKYFDYVEKIALGELLMDVENDFSSAYIYNFMIFDEYQNLGYGSFLLEKAIAFAVKIGTKTLTAEVARNKSFKWLMKFYEKHGFVPCKSRDDSYPLMIYRGDEKTACKDSKYA